MAVAAWKADGINAQVWDGGLGHCAQLVRQAGSAMVPLPPAALELNQAERVFLELRLAVEDLVSATLNK